MVHPRFELPGGNGVADRLRTPLTGSRPLDDADGGDLVVVSLLVVKRRKDPKAGPFGDCGRDGRAVDNMVPGLYSYVAIAPSRPLVTTEVNLRENSFDIDVVDTDLVFVGLSGLVLLILGGYLTCSTPLASHAMAAICWVFSLTTMSSSSGLTLLLV